MLVRFASAGTAARLMSSSTLAALIVAAIALSLAAPAHAVVSVHWYGSTRPGETLQSIVEGFRFASGVPNNGNFLGPASGHSSARSVAGEWKSRLGPPHCGH